MTLFNYLRLDLKLVLKAIAFAIAWLYVPFWLFLLVALYCYFIPFFRTGKFAVPFAVLLVLCLLQSPNILMAIIFGAIFYYLLLIKELLLIDRAVARSFLVMVLSFFLFRAFYFTFPNGPVGAALFGALGVAALFGFLMHNLVDNFRRSYESGDEREGAVRNVVSWLSFLLMAECLIAGLFLPLNFIYQSILVFLAAAFMIDFVPGQVYGTLTWEKVRIATIVFFALFVIVLASARLGV